MQPIRLERVKGDKMYYNDGFGGKLFYNDHDCATPKENPKEMLCFTPKENPKCFSINTPKENPKENDKSCSARSVKNSHKPTCDCCGGPMHGEIDKKQKKRERRERERREREGN